MNWKLVDKTTKTEIKKGDKRTTFRGERVMVLSMQPPHNENSSGKVNVIFIDDAATGQYYAGVIDAEYQLID